MKTGKRGPKTVDKIVGRNVRIFRLAKGLSQTDLADKLGITFQQIQMYEKGTNRIGAGRLQHIAHILHVPVAFFFEGLPQVSGSSEEGAAPLPPYIDDFLATSDGLSLTKSFPRIKNPKLRRSIVDLLEHIAARCK